MSDLVIIHAVHQDGHVLDSRSMKRGSAAHIVQTLESIGYTCEVIPAPATPAPP